jgi:hypothetical protein
MKATSQFNEEYHSLIEKTFTALSSIKVDLIHKAKIQAVHQRYSEEFKRVK